MHRKGPTNVPVVNQQPGLFEYPKDTKSSNTEMNVLKSVKIAVELGRAIDLQFDLRRAHNRKIYRETSEHKKERRTCVKR
jgi:hypothetical protein